jgi:hypothetical protein
MQPSQTIAPISTPSIGLAFLTYFYLQILDLLTTVAFLLSGVEEGNPIVRWAMAAAANPLYGLLLVKGVAVVLGIYCWWTNRVPLIRRVNFAYAALIAWNLCCLIIGLLPR